MSKMDLRAAPRPAVTQVHFGAADARASSYNEGANWVGVLFVCYSASVLGFLLNTFAQGQPIYALVAAASVRSSLGLAVMRVANPEPQELSAATRATI